MKLMDKYLDRIDQIIKAFPESFHIIYRPHNKIFECYYSDLLICVENSMGDILKSIYEYFLGLEFVKKEFPGFYKELDKNDN